MYREREEQRGRHCACRDRCEYSCFQIVMVLTEEGNWTFRGELADFIHKLADLVHKKNHLWPYSNTDVRPETQARIVN